MKSPQHLEQLAPLLSVFPDARIVQTHRDPVRVTASFTTMAAYTLRLSSGAIDPLKVGRYWGDRIERLLNASVRDRDLVPNSQIMDCRFHQFMGDKPAMLERIFAFAEQPIDDTLRARFRAYLDSHGRGRLGRIDYRLEDFGLDPVERRASLGHYQARFDVPDE